jgi:hypothetical protein
MLLLMAHLLSLNSVWQSAGISLKCVSSVAYPSPWSRGRLRDLLEGSRIAAEPEVIDNPEALPIGEVISRHSADADIVFLGLREPAPGEEASYAEHLRDLVRDLPTVVLVRAAGPFSGQLLDSVEAAGEQDPAHDAAHLPRP